MITMRVATYYMADDREIDIHNPVVLNGSWMAIDAFKTPSISKEFDHFPSYREVQVAFGYGERTCKRCGNFLKKNGYCRDKACRYSDLKQDKTEG